MTKKRRQLSSSIWGEERPSTLAYYCDQLFPSQRAHTIQVTSMCEAFQQIGVTTTLFARRNPRYPDITGAELLEEYGVQDPFEVRLLKAGRGVWRQRYLSFVNSYRTSGKYDLCFTRSMIPALSCALRRVPCVCEVHDCHLGITDRKALAVVKRSEAIRFVAISATLAEMVSKEWGIPRGRIAVEHDGYKSGWASSSGPPPIDYDTSRARLKATYVGSFYPGRGIELIQRLAALHPETDFILVGAPADYPFESVPNRDQNVYVFPRIAHSLVPAVLHMADILLMPHGKVATCNEQGLGNIGDFCSPLKLFEYLSAGRPIVASRLPSIQEVVVEGENGLLAEPDDIGEWSLRLDQLKDDAALRRRLSEGALRSSVQYTWLNRAQRILGAVSRD